MKTIFTQKSDTLHFDTVESATSFSLYLKDIIQAIEDTKIKVNTYRWLPERDTDES